MANQRKMIKRTVETVSFEYFTLAQVAKQINQWIVMYGEDATFQTSSDPDNHYEYLNLVVSVPETDEQMNARIEREKQAEKLREERERAEYIRLMNKYAIKKK